MQASNMEPTELARDTTHRNVEIIRCPYMFLFSVRTQMPVHKTPYRVGYAGIECCGTYFTDDIGLGN